MGLFNLFKRKNIHPDAQRVIDNFSASANQMSSSPQPKPLTSEEYAAIRTAERDWIEKHYDFSSIESIEAIPEKKDLPRPPGDSVTGDIYYYLHYRARMYADSLNYNMAIACQKKSNALIKFRYGNRYGRRECYYLVRLLARSGLIDAAKHEKERIDSFYGVPAAGSKDDLYAHNMISDAAKQGRDERDYAWVRINLPDNCPKSKNAFCRMRSQNSTNYKTLKQLAAKLGKDI